MGNTVLLATWLGVHGLHCTARYLAGSTWAALYCSLPGWEYMGCTVLLASWLGVHGLHCTARLLAGSTWAALYCSLPGWEYMGCTVLLATWLGVHGLLLRWMNCLSYCGRCVGRRGCNKAEGRWGEAGMPTGGEGAAKVRQGRQGSVGLGCTEQACGSTADVI